MIADAPRPAGGTLEPAIDLAACEAEPIRRLGLIQPHGCLLVADRRGAVVGRSANAAAMLGLDGGPTDRVDGALGEGAWRRVLAAVEAPGPPRPRLVDLGGCASRVAARFEAVAHRLDDLVAVEFLPRQGDDGPAPGAWPDGDPAGGAGRDGNLFRLALAAADLVRGLAGYDRVMVYRFHPDWSGEVIAEVRRPDLTPYLGLRYPASDIPPQARELYRLNHVRLIADVDAAAVPVTLDADEGPPDLGHAVLRSVSPYHLEYLRNMGVAATLTLSILVEGDLWGMIACHHDGRRVVGYAAQLRALAVAEELAARIAALDAARARRDEAILVDLARAWERTIAPGADLASALLADARSLAAATDADGAAVVCGGTCLAVGAAPDPAWIVRAADRLRGAGSPGFPVASDRLRDEPGGPPQAGDVSGMVAAAVDAAAPICLFAFRRALVHEVHWGGDPNVPALVSRETGRISPRHSFALWRELVRDRARPWEPLARRAMVAAAARLAALAADDPGTAERLAAQLAALTARLAEDAAARRLLIDLLPDDLAVLLWSSRAGRSTLLHANRGFHELFGLDPHDLLGRSPAHVLERTGLDPALIDGSGDAADTECDVWSPTRGVRRMRARREDLVQFRAAGDGVVFSGLLLEDITASRRSQEALEAATHRARIAEEARGALLRNMSHELRTPLNAVLGYADLLSEELLGPLGAPGYVEAAREIRGGARHLLELINNTLDLARLREGRLTLDEAPVDLRRVVAEAARLVEPLAADKAIRVGVAVPDAPLVVVVDELAIRQVAINLLGNAIKFTPAAGEVRLELAPDAAGEVVLAVVDSGIGIPAAAIPSLFKPFSQVDAAIGRRHGGSGLGLALVKSLVSLHGGSVSVDSAEGRGSTFAVRLPAWRVKD